MSTGFFKRNERVVMTLLLILIAPTFAATGLISWWAGNAAAVASYEINGETVSSETFLIKSSATNQIVMEIPNGLIRFSIS